MARAKQRRIEYVALDEIAPADRNAKGHDASLIGGSMDRFGFIEPAVLDERTGRLVAGHGRREKLIDKRDAGESAPEGIVVRDGVWFVPVVRGWSSIDDTEAEAAGIALNRIGEVGGWRRELGTVLDQLALAPRGLEGLGFDAADLDQLPHLMGWDDLASDNGDKEPSTGDLLALVDVTINDPSIEPDLGSVWKLGRHTLVVADVMVGHAAWAGLLSADTVFCPYAGPFLVLAEKADDRPLLLVQPDPYIAGHIIDKWTSIDPKKRKAKLA